MAMTRRKLLGAMARLGGAGAVYETLAAWEFLKPPPAQAAQLGLPARLRRGQDRRHSRRRRGGPVRRLRARPRRLRLRHPRSLAPPRRAQPDACGAATRFAEVGGPSQECRFDEGLWLNAGPGRIPHHHVQVIDYCRQFGVALQPYIFASRANLVHSGDVGNGKTFQVRRALYDLQGHVAELLDKCAQQGRASICRSPATIWQTLQDMLEKFGDLTNRRTRDSTPTATSRRPRRLRDSARSRRPAGQAVEPARARRDPALQRVERLHLPRRRVFLADLAARAGRRHGQLRQGVRAPAARRARPGRSTGLIRYGAKVTGDRGRRATRSTIRFDDGGSERTLAADYCISTIPMPIFKTLPTQPSGGLHGGGARAAGPGGRQGRLAGGPLLGDAATRSTAAFPGPPTSSRRSGTRRPAISAARAC